MIPRANLDYMWHTVIDPRRGTPYNWGGSFDPDDISVGSDCSGAVSAVIEALLYGPDMDWNRQFWTGTFQGLQPGQVGPFGLVCIAGPDAHPADAACIVAIRQGASAESSHMMCQVGGTNIEDGDGLVTGPGAADIHDDQFNQWFYLPGPIVGDVPAPTVLTVPLTSAAGGFWTSPSPAWAHLITRESGGNPTIIQQITDVNSGGNEAEGLFQITPATWRAHGGDEFAPSPRLATPQQQALVAARIFTGNPSGSDWGAGLPGREDANQLAAGLVPSATTPTDGFLMALSDAEQRELLELARQVAAYRKPSRSPLRHVGEGAVDTVAGFELNVDGMTHAGYVMQLARLGDPDALALLREVANLNPAQYPDRAHDKQLAAAILNDIAGQATAESAPPSGQTPGVIPAPIPTPPAVIPTPIPAAIPPQPALPAPTVIPPVTVEGGGLLGEITSLTQKLHDVSQQVTAIVEGV